MIPKNPANFVKAPRVEDFEEEYLNECEIISLLKEIKDKEIFIPVLIAVCLGLRRSEILGLKWSDVDFESKKLYIRRALARDRNKPIFKQPKTKKSKRVISVPESLLEELKLYYKKQEGNKKILGKAYINNDLIVCNNDGSLIMPSTLTKRFKELLRI